MTRFPQTAEQEKPSGRQTPKIMDPSYFPACGARCAK